MRIPTIIFTAPLVLITCLAGSAQADPGDPWRAPELVATPAEPPNLVELPINEADGAEPVSAEPETRAQRPRKKPRKPCAKTRKGCRKHATKENALELELRAAAEVRAEILANAGAIAEEGRTGVAAAALGNAAEAHADPVLYLAAAELELANPELGADGLTLAMARIDTARRLIENPTLPRVPVGEGPALLAQGDFLSDYAVRRVKARRLERRGRAQLISGSVFLGASLGGIAILASGAALGSRVDEAAANYSGTDASYVDALAATRDRATVRIAAGVVTTLIGSAVGIPLVINGVRETRSARETRNERPTLRLTPGVAALAISGRF